MFRCGVILILLGIYLYSIPLYVDFWNSHKVIFISGEIINLNRNSSHNGIVDFTGASNYVSVDVTHNYFGYSLPIYVMINEKIVDVRLIHDMFFNLIYLFVVAICFEFYQYLKD